MADWRLSDFQRQETAGADASASRGTSVTVAGSANTKGSWVELIAATSFEASWLLVQPSLFENVAGIDYLFDIAIGAAGSEQVIIANLPFGTRGTEPGAGVPIPISVPAGSRVAARAQCSSASRTGRLLVQLFGSGFAESSGAQLTVTYGANTADSGGTSVDPGGTAHTKGSWTEITSATTFTHSALLVCFGNQANSARTACDWLVDIGVGAAGSEQVAVADIAAWSDGARAIHPQRLLIPTRVAAGERLSVRAQCSIIDATDRTFDTILIGVS